MRMHASMVSLSNWPPRYSTRPRLLTVADLEHSATEEHWFSVGCASNGAVLSVVYLWSDADPATTNIRMISARKSTQTEIRQYQECS